MRRLPECEWGGYKLIGRAERGRDLHRAQAYHGMSWEDEGISKPQLADKPWRTRDGAQ